MDDQGLITYWAYVDVSHFSVYALAEVLPLVDPDIPTSVSVAEDVGSVNISPSIELEVKQDNQWHLTYPNLRVRSMNVSIAEGFEPGSDWLSMDPVPGFDATWHESDGVLTISAVPGFEFTDNTDDDYDDGTVELVDISEVLDTVAATSTLRDFNAALQAVTFGTSVVGSTDRIMELSVNELLTAAVVARISWARVLNSPDPPEIHPTPQPRLYREQTPLQAVDPEVQV